MYSYTWLEKLMGVPMSNADRILPEFQELKVGDVIAYGPQGPYLPVREVLPNHVFILGGYDPPPLKERGERQHNDVGIFLLHHT